MSRIVESLAMAAVSAIATTLANEITKWAKSKVH